MTTPLVQTIGLTKEFRYRRGLLRRLMGRRSGWLRAVDGVSLAIAKGEVLGLVGESGSGKSTLGRLLLRLVPPSSGQIFFDGQDITAWRERDLRPLRRQMQVIFQNPFASLNPRQTVRQILNLPLRLHFDLSASARRDRTETLLHQVGLSSEQADCYPHQLSGGMRQRVSIARALAVEPAFLVCDEPVSSLDVSIQAQILALLGQLQKRLNLTYLFITHDLRVVRQVADRIAVMRQGAVVEIGDAQTVIDHPRHPYTQTLLASVPELPCER